MCECMADNQKSLRPFLVKMINSTETFAMSLLTINVYIFSEGTV